MAVRHSRSPLEKGTSYELLLVEIDGRNMDAEVVAAVAAVGLVLLGLLKFVYDLGRDVGRRDDR